MAEVGGSSSSSSSASATISDSRALKAGLDFRRQYSRYSSTSMRRLKRLQDMQEVRRLSAPSVPPLHCGTMWSTLGASGERFALRKARVSLPQYQQMKLSRSKMGSRSFRGSERLYCPG